MLKPSRIPNIFWVLLLGLAIAAGSYALQITQAQNRLNDLKLVIESLPPVSGSILEKEFSSPKPEYLLIKRTYSSQESATLVMNHYRGELDKRGYVFINEVNHSTTGSFTLYYCGQSFNVEVDYQPQKVRTATYTIMLIMKQGLEISLARGVRVGSGCPNAKM